MNIWSFTWATDPTSKIKTLKILFRIDDSMHGFSPLYNKCKSNPEDYWNNHQNYGTIRHVSWSVIWWIQIKCIGTNKNQLNASLKSLQIGRLHWNMTASVLIQIIKSLFLWIERWMNPFNRFLFHCATVASFLMNSESNCLV